MCVCVGGDVATRETFVFDTGIDVRAPPVSLCTWQVTLTLDRLLANQLLTSQYLSTATSTATDTMIVLDRDANITLLFEKDTVKK